MRASKSIFNFAAQAAPIAASLMALLYFCATSIFVRKNSHFIADDFDHFADAIVKSLPEMLATRIDVHFVPFHQLASYLIFKLAPLNFDVALGAMIAGWLLGIALLCCVLRRLSSQRGVLLIVLVIATSPAWLHILIWWSAAAHRIPYLILQAATCLAYLRYRESQRKIDAFVCLAMQVIALGFYVKAILFPVILVAIEGCLYFSSRKISREGAKLCVGMSLVSAFYVGWYLVFSPTVEVGHGLDVIGTLSIACHFILRLGALLLFLPIEQVWSEWVAGIFWGSLACWSIWRSPRSAIPIATLTAILLISFTLTAAGRGALVVFPFAAMRYYSDELFVVGIFATLIMTMHAGAREKQVSPAWQYCGMLAFFSVLIAYPVGAYYTNRAVFSKAYEQHRLTHDFMTELKNSLGMVSENPTQWVILKTDFPAFVYGFLGMRKPMADILSAVYPRLEWVNRPDKVRGKVYKINDDGRLALVSLSDSPDFRDNISFPGWNAAEETHRWSFDYHATVLFSVRPNHKYEGELLVTGPVLGKQRVTVSLNGKKIAGIILDENAQCCDWSVRFSPGLLRPDGLNAFEFNLPDARKPGNGDPRVLAIGVRTIQVR